MATLQKLRNNAGILLATVIFIALAAFILGDLLKSGSSLIRGKQLEIAEINDHSIDYKDFQVSFENFSNIYKQNNNVNSLDDNAYKQVLDQTWEYVLQETIMGDVYEELDIDVTSTEMFDLVQGQNVHPYIVQLFGNPETGQVDKSAIIRFLKFIQENPDSEQAAYWMNVETQILAAQKNAKYSTMVGKGIFYNSLQATKSIEEKAKKLDVKWIGTKLSAIADSLVTVSDSDLKTYYDEHIENYKQETRRTIKYVAFDIKPSEQDITDTEHSIASLKKDFERAEDNIQFVNINADSRFEDVYNTKSQLTPEIADWAFEAKVGDVYGPYREGMIYKLVKLNDTKILPDSVKASHILLRAQTNEEAQFAFQTLDSLKTAIEAGKVTFEQAAIDNSQDGSASDGGDLGWFARGRMVAPFERAAFRANKGDLVIAQTQFGIHLIKVTAQGGKSKNVQLAVVDREITPSTTTYQDIYTTASRFAADAQNAEGLQGVAAETKVTPRTAIINKNDRNIAGVGGARAIVRAAFQNAEVGDLVVGNDKSAIFELDDKFVVAALTNETEEGYKPFESVKNSIKFEVIKKLKRDYLANKFASAMGSTIEETAKNLGLEVGTASDFNLNYGSITKIGYDNAVNGAASVLEAGEQSSPIVGKTGVYVLSVTNVKSNETPSLEQEKDNLMANAEYRATYQAYQTLKSEADIDDMRIKFY